MFYSKRKPSNLFSEADVSLGLNDDGSGDDGGVWSFSWSVGKSPLIMIVKTKILEQYTHVWQCSNTVNEVF